jgi:hypothetical protein
MAEADALDGPALVSPTLVYEDGSVHFGGPGQGAPGEPSLLGYPAGWLPPGGARAAATGAAEVALVDRALLARAGGLAGRTFGEALAHRDLARRLRAAGGGTFCAGSVEFWMLDDDAGAHAPREVMADRVDALLLGKDGR